MHLQEHVQQQYLLLYFSTFLFAVLVIYFFYKKLDTKKRLSLVRCRPVSETKRDKIIVACELENVFVNMSDMKRNGFTKINIQTQGFQHLISKIKELFGIGLYYKLKNSRKDIKSFIQTLAENSKVQLFLYTTLSLKVAEQLLQKLGLKTFFKPEFRRSCSDGYSEALKHPTEVDFNTKRVIILTGSKKDHLQEDSKYFLVIKKKDLNDSFKRLNEVIKNNENIDELHNELADLKDQIQSDYENCS